MGGQKRESICVSEKVGSQLDRWSLCVYLFDFTLFYAGRSRFANLVASNVSSTDVCYSEESHKDP